MFLRLTERWVERLILTVAIVGLWATVAHGQSQGQVFDRQRVLLVPMQGQEGVSPVVPTKVFEYLRTLMELNGEVSFFVPQTLTEPPREEIPEVAETDPVLTRADDFLWRAKERAAAGQHLQATNSFKQAVLHYQKGMDNLENFDKVVDARLGIALNFYYAGDEKEGRKALRHLVEVRPDMILDKRKVPKEALDDLEAIKSRIGGTPARPLKVVSSPPGAQVYVDGIPKGVAPLSIQGLTVGRHVLRMVMDGHESRSRAFTTSGAKKKTLKLKLPPKKKG
ncbi:MAG: PEGA domain-containing protein, partial [Myxococcota bacterium]|nr:PEGA domain-containing protein [Myxococcota bacterium]